MNLSDKHIYTTVSTIYFPKALFSFQVNEKKMFEISSWNRLLTSGNLVAASVRNIQWKKRKKVVTLNHLYLFGWCVIIYGIARQHNKIDIESSDLVFARVTAEFITLSHIVISVLFLDFKNRSTFNIWLNYLYLDVIGFTRDVLPSLTKVSTILYMYPMTILKNDVVVKHRSLLSMQVDSIN